MTYWRGAMWWFPESPHRLGERILSQGAPAWDLLFPMGLWDRTLDWQRRLDTGLSGHLNRLLRQSSCRCAEAERPNRHSAPDQAPAREPASF